MSKIIRCIIPARLGSTRLEKKILLPLDGKTMLQRVYESAKRYPFFTSVTIALESQETKEVVESFGGEYVMTSKEHRNGTSRLIEAVKTINKESDIWVNWQADEPFINNCIVDKLLFSIEDDSVDVWTLKKKVKFCDINENTVKVVTDQANNALYFSRHNIPFSKKAEFLFKHIGLYAYTNNALAQIKELEASPLEISESLEQLTFLYHGMRIRVHETYLDSFGVDTHEDHQKAQELINELS
jgi:3-deoxy-manno-octulosonate cytidylyltransferase (CMP-KDO synthetase)